MAMRINEPRSNGHSSDIHHLIHPFGIKVFLLTNTLNQPSVDDEGVRIQNRIRNIS